jgi:hypothetical protein
VLRRPKKALKPSYVSCLVCFWRQLQNFEIGTCNCVLRSTVCSSEHTTSKPQRIGSEKQKGCLNASVQRIWEKEPECASLGPANGQETRVCWGVWSKWEIEASKCKAIAKCTFSSEEEEDRVTKKRIQLPASELSQQGSNKDATSSAETGRKGDGESESALQRNLNQNG